MIQLNPVFCKVLYSIIYSESQEHRVSEQILNPVLLTCRLNSKKKNLLSRNNTNYKWMRKSQGECCLHVNCLNVYFMKHKFV